MIPVLYPVVGAGDPRPRPARLGDVALLRLLGGLQVRRRHGRELVRRSTSIRRAREIVVPDDFPLPADGVSIRWPDPFLATEARMQDYKIYAALALLPRQQAQPHRRSTRRAPRLGIIDVGQELPRRAPGARGPRHRRRRRRRDRHPRLQGRACPGRSSPTACATSREGLEEILVVEEKRQIIEYQMKEQLYNWRDDVRPRVVGKFDEKGEWVRTARRLAAARGGRAHAGDDRARDREAHRAPQSPSARHRRAAGARRLHRGEGSGARAGRKIELVRQPYFCSGCPHNTSTQVPEGSRAHGGHRLPLHGDLDGPRAPRPSRRWAAKACPGSARRRSPKTKHIFANLGDGTYYHSGLLAIRAAVAANVNITYKILYNDAVAMTGGQPVDGPLTPQDIARQVAGRGRQAPRRGDRRAGRSIRRAYFAERDPHPSSRRARRGAARAARDRGRDGPDLRPDLRGREAPPAQARHVRRSREARRHQRARVRRLRRLRRASRTACRSCRWRPSSAASARSTSRRATRTTRA